MTKSLSEVQQKERVRGMLMFLEQKMNADDASHNGAGYLTNSMFIDGIYVREIHIPKGNFVVGKIHKHDHPNMILKGSVMVMTEDGVSKLEAPHTEVSPAGCKRFLFTLEDTIWTTIHRTNATNVVDAEEEIIAKSYTDIGLNYQEVVGLMEEN